MQLSVVEDQITAVWRWNQLATQQIHIFYMSDFIYFHLRLSNLDFQYTCSCIWLAANCLRQHMLLGSVIGVCCTELNWAGDYAAAWGFLHYWDLRIEGGWWLGWLASCHLHHTSWLYIECITRAEHKQNRASFLFHSIQKNRSTTSHHPLQIWLAIKGPRVCLLFPTPLNSMWSRSCRPWKCTSLHLPQPSALRAMAWGGLEMSTAA